MMQVCNQSRSQCHSSFFPSGRTFQVISNRNFHPKEKIFIRNEVNRHCLGYSSIDQLRHGPLRSNLNSARHRTVSVLSVARYIARPVSKGYQTCKTPFYKRIHGTIKMLILYYEKFTISESLMSPVVTIGSRLRRAY